MFQTPWWAIILPQVWPTSSANDAAFSSGPIFVSIQNKIAELEPFFCALDVLTKEEEIYNLNSQDEI